MIFFSLDNDSLGRKTKITYPNNVETTFTFDNYNRLDEMEATKVGSRKYLYDELSNISRIKTESGQFDYAYDQNSSLIGAYYKGSEGINDEKFIWDASGNRLNGTKDPVQNPIKPRPLIINNGLFEDAEPMTSNGVGRFSFIYDMHGNVIKKFDNELNVYYVFEYDADNKLVYAEKFKNDSLELSAKYSYDGLGRRIEKEVTKGSTISRKSYIYNGDNILLEYNTSGAIPVESAKYIGSGSIDDNLMTVRNGKGFFYHKDHLGSIGAITNEAGEIVQSSQYSSFGKILSIKDKERRELGFAKALDQPFYYTGREWDNEIELYYYRARSYDPVTGRWMQKDPIGFAGGDTNLYRYVGNNPVNFIDPAGTDRVEVLLKNGTHVGLLIFDPGMPGNNVLIDFGPDFSRDFSNSALLNVFGDKPVPGVVDFNYGVSRDIGVRIPGTHIRQSREDDYRDISRGYQLQDAAQRGDILYQLFDFNDNDNSFNCRGFVDRTL